MVAPLALFALGALGAGAMEYGNRKSAKAAEEDRAKALQRAVEYSGILGQPRAPGIMGGAAKGPTMANWSGLPRTQQENAVIMNLIQAGHQDKAVGMITDRAKPPSSYQPLSPAAKVAVDMGLQPGSPEFRQYVRTNSGPDILNPDVRAARESVARAGASTTNVNTGTGRRLTDEDRNYYANAREAADNGRLSNQLLMQIAEVGKNVETGAFEKSKLEVGRFFNALGIDSEAIGLGSVSNKQELNRLLAEGLIGQTERMKGVLSETDMEVLRDTLPRLTDEPQAFFNTLSRIIARNQYNIDRFDAMTAHLRGGANDFYDFQTPPMPEPLNLMPTPPASVLPDRSRPGSAKADTSADVTATNPETGEKLRWNAQKGQWERM